jgi:hypothetical protein
MPVQNSTLTKEQIEFYNSKEGQEALAKAMWESSQAFFTTIATDEDDKDAN